MCRFQNPIENGQHCDSTASDVRVMKMRAHVLNKTLRGFVQRKDSSVLKGELPPKCVYVISVRLSNLQRRLYEHYLQIHGMMHDDDEALENKTHRRLLFNAYHSFSKVIFSHQPEVDSFLIKKWRIITLRIVHMSLRTIVMLVLCDIYIEMSST